PHAVRVVGPDGRDLGYLRAQLAGRLSPSIDVGARYHATVMAVTGGGDRALGVNVFLERDDAGGPPAADGVPARAGGDARPPSLRAAWDRPPLEVNDGRPWPAATAAAFRAIAGGTSVVLALPPGCGWAGALAGAAALKVRDGSCVLLVAPLRRQVYHRADQLQSRLARLCPGAEVVCDAPLRTGLRVVDRRSTPDKGATLEEVIGRDEKVVVYAAGREECVQLAQHLRAQHDGLTRRVGYLHGGLPAR